MLEATFLDSPTGEATQLDPSSSTSDSDDGREWSVVLHGRANRRASTSDTVRVSPAPNAVDTGRFAVLAEQSQSKRMRVRESQATTVTAPFLEIADALEYDLTRGDTDVGSHQQSESDTESVGHNMEGAPPRRRLRLTWNVPGAASASHRDTRAVSNLFEQLAGRIGAIPVGGELPRALRQQRWSPVNVPLIWGCCRRR